MQYRNPQRNRLGTFDCEVYHERYGWIPFTANPNDSEEHGRVIYQNILDNYPDLPAWEPPPPPTGEDLIARIRDVRNGLLASSDWTQVGDLPESLKSPWAEYRQKLRDIPSQEGFPDNVEWPIPPGNPDWKPPVFTNEYIPYTPMG